jgi:hypothetical protein
VMFQIAQDFMADMYGKTVLWPICYAA